MPLPAINAHIYACPENVEPDAPLVVDGLQIPTLNCQGLSQSRFPLSFEQAAERLQQVERVYFEFDGSFVWAGRDVEDAWQLYGMLYDYGGSLHRVELKGACSLTVWKNLMRVFGDDRQTLVAHLLDYDCFIDTKTHEQLWRAPSDSQSDA